MFPRIFAILLTSLFVFVAPTGLRAASSEPEIIRLLLDKFEKQFEYRPTYAGIEETSSSIIVHELNLVPPSTVAKGKDTTFVIRTITLSKPALDDGGMYHMDRILIEGGLLKGKDDKGKAMRISIPLITAEDASLLPPAAARNDIEALTAGTLLFSSLKVDDVTIEQEGMPEITLSGFHVSWKGDRRTSEGEGIFDLGRLTIPAELMKLADEKGSLAQLGYRDVTFTFSGKLRNSWDEKSFNHVSGLLRFGMKNAGIQEIAIDDFSAPLVFLKALKALGEKQKNAKKVDEQAFYALLQKSAPDVTILGARISWIDHSLAGRLIGFFAKKQGMERSVYVENLAAYPQVMLMQFGLPKLAAQATPEIRKFLKDPGSLSVSFRAKAPMSFSTLMTLMSDPAGLVETLGLKVEANTLQ